MRKTDLSEMPCPVARSLDIVGEWWTLVIVRDAFRGARRFEEFRAVGIADNILSARLKRLVDEGIFERVPYQEHPARFEYLLTEKGRELAIVLAALATWGKRWTDGPDLSRISHGDLSHGVTMQAYCEECARPINPEEIRVQRLRPSSVGAGTAAQP